MAFYFFCPSLDSPFLPKDVGVCDEDKENKPGPGVVENPPSSLNPADRTTHSPPHIHSHRRASAPKSGRLSKRWLRPMSLDQRAHSIMANEVKRSSNIYKRALWRCTVLWGGRAATVWINQSCLFNFSLKASFPWRKRLTRPEFEAVPNSIRKQIGDIGTHPLTAPQTVCLFGVSSLQGSFSECFW